MIAAGPRDNVGVASNARPHRFPGFWRRPRFALGMALLIGLIFFCFVGPLLDHVNPDAINLAHTSAPPSWHFWLGTDSLGRSEMTRMMVGGRLLIIVGLASAAVGTAIGTLIGLAGALWRGWLDRAVVWVMDVVLGIPQLVPLLLVDQLLKPDALTLIFVVGVGVWPVVGRLVRAEALSLRERDYVTAARSLGASQWRILTRHLFRNLGNVILVALSNQVGVAVLLVATASFLGMGLPPPAPNWGQMINSATAELTYGDWWLLVFPGLAFVALQISVNYIADALRTEVRGAHR